MVVAVRPYPSESARLPTFCRRYVQAQRETTHHCSSPPDHLAVRVHQVEGSPPHIARRWRNRERARRPRVAAGLSLDAIGAGVSSRTPRHDPLLRLPGLTPGRLGYCCRALRADCSRGSARESRHRSLPQRRFDWRAQRPAPSPTVATHSTRSAAFTASTRCSAGSTRLSSGSALSRTFWKRPAGSLSRTVALAGLDRLCRTRDAAHPGPRQVRRRRGLPRQHRDLTS